MRRGGSVVAASHSPPVQGVFVGVVWWLVLAVVFLFFVLWWGVCGCFCLGLFLYLHTCVLSYYAESMRKER